MRLLVGLGNPGPKHARQRHNIGFMAVDKIAEDYFIGPWRQKFQGSIATGQIDSQRVILLKPETYMNDSGRSVGELVRYHKISLENVIVFHDELDLEPGRIRTKIGGGNAGHRGLNSIQAHIGGKFVRVRIGIGHPGRKDLVSHYVLHSFSSADKEWLEDILKSVSLSVSYLVAGSLEGFARNVAESRNKVHLSSSQHPSSKPIKTETEGGIFARILGKLKL